MTSGNFVAADIFCSLATSSAKASKSPLLESRIRIPPSPDQPAAAFSIAKCGTTIRGSSLLRSACMTKHIVNVLCLALIGCGGTDAAPTATKRTAGKKAKAVPNLDRTYDWGARPPVANPDRNKD